MAEKSNPTVTIALEVNGKVHSLPLEPRTTLLEVLRERLGLTGAKPACEQGECGACTVLVDGRPVNSCILLAVQAAGRPVSTVEGLHQEPKFQALAKSLVARDGGQCGYCTPGFAVAAYALLRDRPQLDEWTIRWTLVGHICRCNAYESIVEAIQEANALGRPG